MIFDIYQPWKNNLQSRKPQVGIKLTCIKLEISFLCLCKQMISFRGRMSRRNQGQGKREKARTIKKKQEGSSYIVGIEGDVH